MNLYDKLKIEEMSTPRFLEHSEETMIKMREAFNRNSHRKPNLFRTTKRIFYHGVGEYGIKKSGFCSIKRPLGMNKTTFFKEYDLEDDHSKPPEFRSLFIFAHYDLYLADNKECFENFKNEFYDCSRTHKVTGVQNRKLAQTSGLIDKGVIKKRATALTDDKYSSVGIKCLYHIDNNEEVPIENFFKTNQDLKDWEVKFWNDEYSFNMIQDYGTLQNFV